MHWLFPADFLLGEFFPDDGFEEKIEILIFIIFMCLFYIVLFLAKKGACCIATPILLNKFSKLKVRKISLNFIS